MASVLGELFWNAAYLWPLAVLAGMGGMLAVFVLYPTQLRGKARIWQFVLPTLRLLVIAALILAILKPTLIRPKTDAEAGAVLLLVDRSASMGLVDSQTAPAAQVALADALAMLPAGKRELVRPDLERTLGPLRSETEVLKRAVTDLEYARLSGREVPRREAEFRQSVQRSMELATKLSEALSGWTVQELARGKLAALRKGVTEKSARAWAEQVTDLAAAIERGLAEQQAAADGRLYASDPEVRDAVNNLAHESRFRLAEKVALSQKGLLASLGDSAPMFGFAFADQAEEIALRTKGGIVGQLGVEADGAQSRIVDAVGDAVEHLRGRPVQAAIVISDGRAVGDVAIGGMPKADFPIYGIQLGSGRSLKDLSITVLRAPASAFVGEKLNVKARVTGTNIGSADQQVDLAFASDRQTRSVRLDDKGNADVEFQLTAGAPGIQELKLSVHPVEGEATAANNVVVRPIKVIDGKIKLTLLAGAANWDYQYIRNALSRAAWAELTDSVLSQPDGRFSPAAEKSIASADVIALFDVSPQSLKPEQAAAIVDAVAKRGASVLLVPGSLTALDALSADSRLAELLPYKAEARAAWRDWPGDRPVFRIVPSQEGARSEALRLADKPEDSAARWANLPGVYHYLALPPLKANVTKVLLVERDSQSPVLLESRLGLGRVFFMGLQETWRWRMRVGERDQDRLWLQLLRYASESPYAVGNGDLWADMTPLVGKSGEAVQVRAKQPASRLEPPQVEIRAGAKVVRLERMAPGGEQLPGRFEASLRDLPDGEYEIAISSAKDQVKMPLRLGAGLQAELADVSAEPAHLRRLAAASGGISVPVERFSEIPQQIRQLRTRITEEQEIALWTSGYVYLFILSALAAEWAIRKRLGLA